MRVGPDHCVPVSLCLDCGVELDMAASVGEDDTPSPSPDDFTVCIRCGHLMAYDQNLCLRNLTDEEIHIVAGDERVLAIQRARIERYAAK